MPFSLQVQPRMGEYTMAAAQSIASNITDARKKKEETEKKLGESDILLDYARQHGLVTAEEDAKYAAANENQKVGMAESWAKTIALSQAQELQSARLAQELQIAQMHDATARANAGIGLTNMGQPVYMPDKPQTPENLLGFSGRYGSVDYLPQGAGGIPQHRTSKGAIITADNLEEYAIPDSEGKATKNTVVRTKDTHEIVPNNLIQGTVRPDPMTTLLMENLAENQRKAAEKQGGGVSDAIANWFRGNKATPTPGPTAAPTVQVPTTGGRIPAGYTPRPYGASDIGGVDLPPTAPDPLAGTTAPAIPAIPQVTTEADYNKLPSGSVYIAPDGSKRTKP